MIIEFPIQQLPSQATRQLESSLRVKMAQVELIRQELIRLEDIHRDLYREYSNASTEVMLLALRLDGIPYEPIQLEIDYVYP